MKRRNFIYTSTAAVSGISILGATIPSEISDLYFEKPDWLVHLIKQNDQFLLSMLASLISEPSNKDFGGFKDANDIPNVHRTAEFIKRLACAVYSSESIFYHSDQFNEKLEAAILYLIKSQHADGSIDLLETNFQSTPDTGFLVKRLCQAYHLLIQSGPPRLEMALSYLKIFLVNAGKCLSLGGIHTPNHRWVVCAALTKLNEIWPNEMYIKRIDQWLAEHIDMDEDGQYNERSSYIYSPLTNKLLITIAKGLNKPELYHFVRKNLSMTMYYVHPNGEIVTEASGRQDNAIIGTLENYFYPYLYMAFLDNDTNMSAMCHLILKTAGDKISDSLSYILEDTQLWKKWPMPASLPENYIKEYKKSGLVRIRKQNWDATILQNNSTWLSYHKYHTALQAIRLAASFFGKGQFQSDKIEWLDDHWLLSNHLEGPYYQPLSPDKIAVDGDWEKMPRKDRSQSEIQKLDTKIRIKPLIKGLEIEIEMNGTNGVPLALELVFRSGGLFTGVTAHPTKPNCFLFKESLASYTANDETIFFGPGLQDHKAIHLRGAAVSLNGSSVYITGFTPFRHKLSIY